MPHDDLRNVAIIAHVDHGKTTLVDALLRQSGQFRAGELEKHSGGQSDLILDSNDQERERGITIFSKNCAVTYTGKDGKSYRINLIDTPGHADFGGEVERVLRMADGVLLVVDAFEGPMPQTRFVLGKALALGLRPIVVVNKIDRPDARPQAVVDETFDLLVALDAPDKALDFPIVYASAKEGWATMDHDALDRGEHAGNIAAVFDAIVDHVPSPPRPVDEPLQMLVTTLDYSDYVGRIAIGRVVRGTLRGGQEVAVMKRGGRQVKARLLQLLAFDGLGRREVDAVEAGDLCAVVGIDGIDIGDTIADPAQPEALPPVRVDEPTLSMTFRVNDSSFAGREGKYVTGRQVWDRLQKELQSNVALRVERGDEGGENEFLVSGRGLMHLGVLIENMRREGYELAVGKPRVILKEINGEVCEPIEQLVIECPRECQSSVMSLLGDRRAEMTKMEEKAGGSETVEPYSHLEFTIPSRGLIGLRTRLLTATQGRAVVHHTLLRYEPVRGEVASRPQGVMIASDTGSATAYSLDRLFDRGVFFVQPGDAIYEGQIVGEHCKDTDIPVNLAINKKLSNVRTTSKDDATNVRPARLMSLEACLAYIEDDELVEVTPGSVRLRKRRLKESERRKTQRDAKNAARGRELATV